MMVGLSDGTHNTWTLKVKQINGIQPLFILLFTPVIFLQCDMFKMSSAKKKKACYCVQLLSVGTVYRSYS